MERRQHPDPYGQLPIPYIVERDDVLLAPRESDLMFIGGGIDEIWKNTYFMKVTAQQSSISRYWHITATNV
jgi:hypothetical protein